MPGTVIPTQEVVACPGLHSRQAQSWRAVRGGSGVIRFSPLHRLSPGFLVCAQGGRPESLCLWQPRWTGSLSQGLLRTTSVWTHEEGREQCELGVYTLPNALLGSHTLPRALARLTERLLIISQPPRELLTPAGSACGLGQGAGRTDTGTCLRWGTADEPRRCALGPCVHVRPPRGPREEVSPGLEPLGPCVHVRPHGVCMRRCCPGSSRQLFLL